MVDGTAILRYLAGLLKSGERVAGDQLSRVQRNDALEDLLGVQIAALSSRPLSGTDETPNRMRHRPSGSAGAVSEAGNYRRPSGPVKVEHLGTVALTPAARVLPVE
jgi:hypothetical protein